MKSNQTSINVSTSRIKGLGRILFLNYDEFRVTHELNTIKQNTMTCHNMAYDDILFFFFILLYFYLINDYYFEPKSSLFQSSQ